MLRKDLWNEMMEEFEEITTIMNQNARQEFFINVKFKVQAERRKLINITKKRAGQRKILSIVDLDKEDKMYDKISDLTRLVQA